VGAQVSVEHPRLDHGEFVVGRHLEDAREPLGRYDEFRGGRRGAARQPRAGTARHDGDAVLGGRAHDRLHLLDGVGQRDGRADLVGEPRWQGALVVRVPGCLGRRGAHIKVGVRFGEVRDQRGDIVGCRGADLWQRGCGGRHVGLLLVGRQRHLETALLGQQLWRSLLAARGGTEGRRSHRFTS
jgi:hypothetical protein